MSTLSFEIPDEAALALKTGPGEAIAEVRLAAAMKLYELGRLSSGSAAALAGLPRILFLLKLADYGVATFRLSEAELASDISNA
ncbi:MAG: UPF0175 family protein [Myxococcales bacterium]|nr:UPF0175 family protein [Myxococcales bacterium]